MKILINELRYLMKFGVLTQSFRILKKVFSLKIFPEKVKMFFILKKHYYIKRYLKKEYRYLIEKYKNEEEYLNSEVSNKVWILWWQGIDNAPDIVKKCIDSIQENTLGKEIIILDKRNYCLYVDIPDVIIDKLENEKISKAFFSDILRMNLLSKYGGYWIDATIFMTGDILNKISEYKFFTLRLNENDEDNKKMVSRGRWCGFFIGGTCNILFKFCMEVLNDYCIKQNMLIDYFLIDYVINIAYEEISSVKDMIDDLPKNNENIFKLYDLLNLKFSECIFNELITTNDVHKLSYRNTFINHTEFNEITFYGQVMNKTKERLEE